MIPERKPREGNCGGYQTALAVAEPEGGADLPVLNRCVPRGSGVEYGARLPGTLSGHEDVVDPLANQELNNVLKKRTVNQVCEA
jgi:hypothetical protein